MAVDPITTKILVHIAGQAATDDQTRKRLLCIILGSAFVFFLLIALILYILISLLSIFAEWIIGDERSESGDGKHLYATGSCGTKSYEVGYSMCLLKRLETTMPIYYALLPMKRSGESIQMFLFCKVIFTR